MSGPGVNSKGTTGGATSVSSSAVTTAASGSSILLGVITADATLVTIPNDSKGNSYTAVAAATGTFAGPNKKLWVFYKENAAGGTLHTGTANVNTTDAITLLFQEVQGVLTSAALDALVSAFTNDLSSPFTTTGGTPAQANEIAWTLFSGNDGSNTTSSITGWTKTAEETNGASFYDGVFAYKNNSSIATSTPSWTRTGATDCGVGLIAFKDAAAGGSFPPVPESLILKSQVAAMLAR